MKQSIYLRPVLTIVFLFVGTVIANWVIPPDFIISTKVLIIAIAALAFAFLGFLMPELFVFFAKAGIEEFAKQISRYVPQSSVEFGSIRGQIRFGKKKKNGEKYVNPIVVDTSVFVDGRLGDIIKSGFVMGTMIVLPSVITELHQLSDSSDDLKRARGRRGLDILDSIMQEKNVRLEVLDSEPSDLKVDSKLLTAAKKYKAAIMTVDFNLGKVAKVKGLRVLNVNELANSVKTVTLPGEELTVLISAAGKGKGQGVGFLDDGTMVVVEGGASFVGQERNVKVNKVLQTAAGKMIFTKVF